MKFNLRKVMFGLLAVFLVSIILAWWEKYAGSKLEIIAPISTATLSFPAKSLADILPLRDYATPCKITIGTAVEADALRDEPAYQQMLAREFDSVTPENAMKFRNLSLAPGQYDFTDADAIVDFALANQMQVRGHTLVWDQALPNWLENGNYSNDAIANIFTRHISTVVGRYQDKIATWDVVNEAVNYDGNLRDSFWLRALGKDYIEMAFRIAHKADPKAKLFYSDYGGEGLGTKSDAIYALAKGLVDRGVPINGVAFHMHLGLSHIPDWQDVQNNIKRLTELGLEVQISEMDVTIQDIDLPLNERLAKQAEVYKEGLNVCLENTGCTSFSTWGFTDRHTWITDLTGKLDFPLLFDENYQPKPAYYAVADGLRNCCATNGERKCPD